MTNHRFTDASTITGARKTADGFIVAEAFVARAGVQIYRGAEVGLAERDVIRVWRPEDEVKAPASVRGYSHAPITLGHPAEFVTADNWSSLAKGEVSTEAEWKDGKLRLPLIVKDAAAIAAIEGGTRELSAGYTCALEFADGITPEGESYDAIQRDIRINHLAIVPRGRAGSECRIGDDAEPWGATPITDAGKEVSMTLRKIMVDGLEVETTDAGAAAITKLTNTIATKDAALAQKDADHAEEVAAKDAQIAKVEAERDAAKGKIVSDADLDKRVAARADLIGKAKAIADADYAGKSDAEIRKAAVAAKLGDEALADKSDAYIEARFDILAEDATPADPLRAALKDAKPVQDARAKAEAARLAYHQQLRDGYKAAPVKH
ncbi:MAG TPA: hypothetical protein DEB47_17680 [Citreicella sp.]|nr:hypothetical protein [Citreicella sp.]